ncbi:Na-translocating system protein MpsC family protein [Alkalicoccus halolimnae]|uniref:Na-translocating system protein MpsC family protein n=1 Tax=Alkalicoccus halolimnae TaxID=1667239 RepID=A0A5C7FPY5_9BACI|nr:Na-translocating system protein MpsC family protein [Alkalicoccus halolimnae]TXF86795.1 DUF2294 family protein [Alkalicoccus halolimnae]
MSKEKTMEAEISGYISSLLRTHFGKGPSSVFVTIKRPFFTVHFRGFIAPMEKILLKQNESKRVLETRDMLLSELRDVMIKELWNIAELDVKEIYADWDLERETGVIMGILREGNAPEETEWVWPDDVNKEEVVRQIEAASDRAEKVPDETEVYWLNERTIFVRRKGILVRIEKELIKNGNIQDLKQSKRPLERDVLKEVPLQGALKRKVNEYFVDWNFDTDEGFVVLILDPEKKPLT